tara:strand:- start:38 stop:667 length:630 start_codon:yes stop_codon:yes gene_type:complete
MIVKICGIQNKETLICCENKNVDFFGMIFHSKSPRNISINQAEELQKNSCNMNIKGVGVFVNENIENIVKYIDKLKLKLVQLHGEEDEKYINEIKKFNIKVIKKISVSNKKDIENIKNYKNVDYFLFDYKPKQNELPGGNAKSFDWNILKEFKLGKPWFLSGGINIDNIQYLKTEIKPFGIDLSSGVEKELGIKDNQIINNFIEKLKNA